MTTLVIVPCGKKKIWSDYPTLDYAKAELAYTGTLFRLNRSYAQQFDKWMILSALYGYITPETLIQDYNVSFKNPKTNPISLNALMLQVATFELHFFDRIIGLGGKEYRQAVKDSFSTYNKSVEFPFAGLSIGNMQRETKKHTRKKKLL